MQQKWLKYTGLVYLHLCSSFFVSFCLFSYYIFINISGCNVCSITDYGDHCLGINTNFLFKCFRCGGGHCQCVLVIVECNRPCFCFLLVSGVNILFKKSYRDSADVWEDGGGFSFNEFLGTISLFIGSRIFVLIYDTVGSGDNECRNKHFTFGPKVGEDRVVSGLEVFL